MVDKMPFPTTCPNGHDAHPAYTKEEWRKEIESGTLRFDCDISDESWMPSAKEFNEVRGWLNRDPSNDRA